MEPKWLRIRDIPLYVEAKTGVKIARATAYNWTTKGRITYDGDRKVLQTKMRSTLKLTTEQWIDDFLQEFQDVS
jgi:hypothetical protein